MRGVKVPLWTPLFLTHHKKDMETGKRGGGSAGPCFSWGCGSAEAMQTSHPQLEEAGFCSRHAPPTATGAGIPLASVQGCTKVLLAGEPLLSAPALSSLGTPLLTHISLGMTEGPWVVYDLYKCLQALMQNLWEHPHPSQASAEVQRGKGAFLGHPKWQQSSMFGAPECTLSHISLEHAELQALSLSPAFTRAPVTAKLR